MVQIPRYFSDFFLTGATLYDNQCEICRQGRVNDEFTHTTLVLIGKGGTVPSNSKFGQNLSILSILSVFALRATYQARIEFGLEEYIVVALSPAKFGPYRRIGWVDPAVEPTALPRPIVGGDSSMPCPMYTIHVHNGTLVLPTV